MKQLSLNLFLEDEKMKEKCKTKPRNNINVFSAIQKSCSMQLSSNFEHECTITSHIKCDYYYCEEQMSNNEQV